MDMADSLSAQRSPNSASNTMRSLVRFDLSSIPPNATITSAILYLTVAGDAADNTRTLRVYRLLHAWDEGQATWNVFSTGNNWGAAGGAGTADIDSTDMGSVSVPESAAAGDVIAIPLTPSEVAKLINGTNANYGWLLKMDTELNDKHAYASSSATNADSRPKLVIQYNTATSPSGWTNRTYTYGSAAHVHAVTALSTGEQYTYDLNGNMTCRLENGLYYYQEYNAENRLWQVTLRSGSCTGSIQATWTFTYDGDGNRVKQVYTPSGGSTLTTYYFAGGAYEVRKSSSTTTTIKYYSFAGMAVAMNDGSDINSLKYFITDHLGSVIMLVDKNGTPVTGSTQRYLPFGQVRSDYQTMSLTDYGFTGQRNLDAQGSAFSLGLMDYKARFYDPYIGRFITPDTIVPNPADTQAFNRYSYASNSPINFIDPTGHEDCSTLHGQTQQECYEESVGSSGGGDGSSIEPTAGTASNYMTYAYAAQGSYAAITVSGVTYSHNAIGNIGVTGGAIARDQGFAFNGTYYKPSTVAQITADGLLEKAAGPASLGFAAATSLVANGIEYGVGAKNIEDLSNRTLKNPEFWGSTVTDTILIYTAGVVAAAAVGLFIAATAPVSLPIAIFATVGVATLIGVGIHASGIDNKLDKAIAPAFNWVKSFGG